MGPNQQRYERLYPVAPDILFEALRATTAIGGKRMRDVVVDEFTRSVNWRAKPTMLAWGFNWQGQVEADPNGARLVLMAANRSSNPTAVSGTKQASQQAAKLFENVSKRCAELTHR